MRHRLSARLPVDVLATHYPDRHGQVLVNVDLHRSTDKALRPVAAVLGQRPQDVLRRRVTAALTRHAQYRARRLEIRLESLPADHTPEEVLACVAGFLHSRHRPGTRTAPYLSFRPLPTRRLQVLSPLVLFTSRGALVAHAH